MGKYIQRMKEMNLPQSIFIDCTSSEDVVAHYAEVLESSVSIVTPNKIANSGKLSNYKNFVRSPVAEMSVSFTRPMLARVCL